ncbi:unnamed protein product [marine sediment metagenome]|uniref:Uncharacterized protein n=1 Tax=marine sediment metagenome TaxID=412755 RepID=X0X0J5_9ZZZZ
MRQFRRGSDSYFTVGPWHERFVCPECGEIYWSMKYNLAKICVHCGAKNVIRVARKTRHWTRKSRWWTWKEIETTWEVRDA